MNRKITKRLDKPVAFLLSFFLLLPTATQCMKRYFSQITNPDDNSLQITKKIKPITIQNLKEEYENLKTQLSTIRWRGSYDEELKHLISCLYPNHLYPNHDYCDPNHDYCGFIGYLLRSTEYLKSFNVKDKKYQEYSFLGIAIMAPCYLHDKKELIKRLLAAECIATEKDKNLALVEKLKRCAPSIIKKICTFQHAPLLTEINMPEEIHPYIALLMFNTEESLL